VGRGGTLKSFRVNDWTEERRRKKLARPVVVVNPGTPHLQQEKRGEGSESKVWTKPCPASVKLRARSKS